MEFPSNSGLTEQFVYFNDDMFLLKPVYMEDFFKDEKPIDMLALQPDVANVDDPTMPYIYLNNTMLLAKYFDKRSNIKKQPWAYFHIGYPPMYFLYNVLELAFQRFTGFIRYMDRLLLRKVLIRNYGSWNRNYCLMYAVIRSDIGRCEPVCIAGISETEWRICSGECTENMRIL